MGLRKMLKETKRNHNYLLKNEFALGTLMLLSIYPFVPDKASWFGVILMWSILMLLYIFV